MHFSERRHRGAYAEDIAAAWLRWIGFEILDRNRRAGEGEVDLVARDGTCLVFVEVRARRAGSWVSASRSIGRDKWRRLRSCAGQLGREPGLIWPGRRMRFDVIAVEFASDQLRLRHLRNVRP